MKIRDTYKEPYTLELDGAIVRVYVPEISEEERARRMKVIHNAAAELLKWKAARGNG